jgi:hypothetical protein
MEYPGFVNGSAPSQSAIATSERTVNFYVEKVGTQGVQHKTALYPTPGQQAWITAASSGGVLVDVGGRGGIWTGARAFVLIGPGYYEVNADGTIVRRGTVAIDGNVAQCAYNGTTGGQVAVCSGSNLYIHTLSTNAFAQVLTGEAHQVAMLDEYFLALNQTTGKLRLSNLNDGLTWDPTQFALRSAQPDPWVGLVVNAPDIWLIGGKSADVWTDAGTSPFPLAARVGLNIPYGLIAPFSLKVVNGQILYLSANEDGAGMVVRLDGYSPRPVSSLELDTAIAGYQRTAMITDAEALSFQMLGHTFYVLRFPSANATWLYDLTTDMWTEAGTWNSARGDYDVWSPRFHLYAFGGKHIVGGNGTGQLSLMDPTYTSEADGSVIRRLRRGPVLVNELKRISINRFEVALEAGLGATSGQGSDPQVMARFSADGGKTWGVWRSAGSGQIGKYNRRVVFNRLGSPRLFVPEIVMTDPVPWRIVDCYLNNGSTVGASAA